MMVIGLTGGVGSGKSTAAQMFEDFGIPVYYADDEAKALMIRSKVIRRKLIALFGDQAYDDRGLNRSFLASEIFNDLSKLEKMNAIVHPKVRSHFKRWVKKQKAPYVIKEAAILFESGSYTECDLVITVTAPENLRIERVMQRDKVSKQKVKDIIKNQWPDEERVSRSDFVITNRSFEDMRLQVESIHKEILDKLQ